VLALQSQVAVTIAHEIEVQLTPQEEVRLAGARPVDPDVYEAFLKGRFYSEQATAGALQKSIEFLDTAINKDPTYGPAYARLAWVHATEPLFFLLDAKEGASRAKVMAARALALDGNLEDAHLAMARATATYDHDWNEAEKSFQHALDANPNSARAHSDYGWFLTWIGRHDDAIAEQRTALALDPLSSSVAVRFGGSLIFARRYGEAIELLKQTVSLHPSFGFGYLRLCVAYSLERMYEEALDACEQFRALDDTARGKMYLSRLYALMGEEARARELMKGIEQANLEHPPAHMMARIYAALGENDSAIDWLERGYEIGDANMVLIKVNPDFDPLRSDPRFQDLLHRMNFP
jgi:adenylate cyclase